jgi:hypothetical protein
MEKPELKDLKAGMVFFNRTWDDRITILIIDSAPSDAINNSFTLRVIDLEEQKVDRNYWKSNSWKNVELAELSKGEMEKIIRTLFRVKLEIN